MISLIRSLALLAAGLTAGWLTRRLANKKQIPADRTRRWVRVVQSAVLLIMVPLSTWLAVWVARLDSPQYLWIPVMGGVIMLVSALISILAAMRLSGPGPRKAALFMASGFGNLGAIGSLILFITLGEAALAYQPLYRLVEKPLIYGLGFPVVKNWSQGTNRSFSLKAFLSAWRDPYLLAVLAATALGVGLNLGGIVRPAYLDSVNGVLVPVLTVMLMWTVGMDMRLSRILDHWRIWLLGDGLRLIVAPLAAVGLVLLTPLPQLGSGLPARVMVLMAASPPAFLSQVAISRYDGDMDVSSAIFLTGTALYAITLPLWVWLTGILF